ncbi:MAG TPA: ROK family protein [Tepidisphaeraceae bacterium]|jgi:glucokinase
MSDLREFLAIEIGGTKLQIVRGNAKGKLTDRWRVEADRAGGGPAICRQILNGIDQMRAKGAHPAAIGVGFGGPVNRAAGTIVRSHQIHGWENFPIRDWLSKESGLPVIVENDSNLAAYGEALKGSGEGFDPVFYFNLGSGVGGGIVIGAQIYHGLAPGEAEFGHIRLDREGTTVESRCSGWAIDRRIRELARRNPLSVLGGLAGEATVGESKFLPEALMRNDPDAKLILGELAGDLAFGLSHVVQLIHPAVLVLGGGLAHLGEPLRSAVAEELPKHVMEVFCPPPPLRLAELGEDAVPVGALLLASTLL